MSIVSRTLTSPQTSELLTTVENVKEELCITDFSKDARLGRLVARASRAIETFLGRELGQATIVEKLPPVDRLRQVLRYRPVKSVSELLENEQTIPAGDDGYLIEDKGAGILYRSDAWRIGLPYFQTIASTRRPEHGEELYQVTYVAGYWLPGWTGTPGAGDVLLPPDIEAAAIESVRAIYFGSERDPALSTRSLGDFSESFAASAVSSPYGDSGLLKRVERSLGRYRRNVQA